MSACTECALLSTARDDAGHVHLCIQHWRVPAWIRAWIPAIGLKSAHPCTILICYHLPSTTKESSCLCDFAILISATLGRHWAHNELDTSRLYAAVAIQVQKFHRL